MPNWDGYKATISAMASIAAENEISSAFKY